MSNIDILKDSKKTDYITTRITTVVHYIMALVIHMKVQISDLSLFNYLMMNTLKFQ